MKQKNMILIGVAVGFGLLAALLATQMNAKPQEVVITEVDLPVAAAEIPINTKLTKDELKTYVTWKKFKKEAVPPGDYATTEEELNDKRVTRTFHEGELLLKADLSTKPLVEIPPGYDMLTFNINREKIVGGFAVPGSKVDILATIPLTKLNKAITIPLFTDMLILAVGVNTKPLPGQLPDPNVTDVSMAVTKEQARMLHAAIGRGADMRLLLINQNKDKPAYKEVPTEEMIWQILADEYDPKKGRGDANKPEDKKFETVYLPVPKEDLPAGTELTKEVIETKFGSLKIEPPAPGNVVVEIKEQMGKFLTRDLVANQFVPKSFLADSFKPKLETVETPVGPPPVYWDVTVQTISGVKKFRYEKRADGKGYIYRGEVKIDDHQATDEKPKSDAKPDENKKPVEPRVIRAGR